MAQSDEILLYEILKGNQSAMEVLVKRHYDLVHSFIYRNTGDYNIAYDLTQEVFIKMMKNLNKYNIEDKKFRSWLLKIASNSTKDYFKSKAYKQRSEYQNIEQYEIPDKNNVVDLLDKKEEVIKIKKAVNALPNLQREAIILKYYNDLKIREISNITGENENTIKSRLFNGIKTLKKLLGGDICEKRTKECIKHKV